MNTYVLALGSNYEAQKNISIALKSLETLGVIISQSCFIKTDPIGMFNKAAFTNGLLMIESALNPTQMKEQLRLIESELGKTNELKAKEIIPVDIDIISCNDAVISNDIEREYIQLLLTELHHK
jgi:2-amino-4-hydroxy-6-hydroxymethyldihydropteridine diphosphokinase